MDDAEPPTSTGTPVNWLMDAREVGADLDRRWSISPQSGQAGIDGVWLNSGPPPTST